jgi:3-oxoacyl-[acyl-carrier-protein] synthase III
MTDVFMTNLCYALGDEMRSVEQTHSQQRTVSEATILRDAGFNQHFICSPKTTAYDLARRALEPIRDALDGVDTIIYSTCLPLNGNVGEAAEFQTTGDVKHLMDFPASHLQSDFEMSDATVIGVNQQACTGMLGSLRLARALLIAEPEISKVLCITADRFPEGALYEQSYNLISDGAAGCIVSTEPAGFRLLACRASTNGALAMASDDEAVGSFFTYSHRTIQAALAAANLTIDQIDWIVPQNTNLKAWQVLSSLLRTDFKKVSCPTLSEIGHVISGDNIINLHRMLKEGLIKSGQRIMLFMAGYGLNWHCVIVEAV